MPKSVILGVGELDVISSSGDVMKTYALGSCVSVVLFCPDSSIIGMVHIALSNSEIDKIKAAELPGYFADTGIQVLIRKMRNAGCLSQLRQMKAKLVGGASVFQFTNDVFNIGIKNINAVKSILDQVKIPVISEDIGGTISRTVEVRSGTFSVFISSPTVGKWKI